MSNNVPVLMLRGANGKFFPVAGITGGGSGGTGGHTKDMAYFAWVTTTKDINNCIVTINEEITD